MVEVIGALRILHPHSAADRVRAIATRDCHVLETYCEGHRSAGIGSVEDAIDALRVDDRLTGAGAVDRHAGTDVEIARRADILVGALDGQ